MVRVEWIDNASGGSGFATLLELSEFKPAKCVTIGFLLKDSKDFILVSSTLGEDSPTSEEKYAQIMILMKSNIVTMTELEAKKNE